MFKIDFYKAFDYVRWGFLDCVLAKMGFGEKWRRWLNTCWKTTSFSVLLNGSPGNTFKRSRGLCQGDPLSPMIFILAVEVLARMFLKAQEVGLIHSFKVSKECIGLLILQFVDDALICVEGDLEGALKVRNIFVWFEVFSGFRVNT